MIASYNTAAIVFIIPLYILFSKVGLLNNYLALVPRAGRCVLPRRIQSANWSAMAAGGVLVVVPMLVATMCIQRGLIRRLTVGAVK